MTGPLFESQSLLSKDLALFLVVTPQTPWDKLNLVTWQLWHLFQSAEREVSGAIGEALDNLTDTTSKR